MMTASVSSYKKSFFDYFPAPRFLKMSTVGLAFSDDAIRIIEFKGVNGSLSLGRFGEMALPIGSIKDGYIAEIPSLSRFLSEIKSRKNLSFVRASLPEEKGYVFTIRVPDLSYKEIRSSIEYKMEENVPLSLSEIIFDFNIIPDSRDENGTIEVAVSVLPEKVVTTYVDALHSADIEPVAFEIESQAIARAVVKKDEKGVYAIANISKHKVGLYIVNNGVVVFTSTLSMLDREKGQSFEAFMLEEMEKLFIFWTTRKGDNIKQSEHIAHVKLVGDHPDMERLKVFLSAGLVVPAEIGNVWTNAFSFERHIPEISKRDSVRFAAAVGLALSSHNL